MIELRDSLGNIRRCGTIPRAHTVKAGAAFEDQVGEWTEADIRKAIRNPKRVPVLERLRQGGFLDTFTDKANQQSFGSCNGWLAANAYTLCRWLGGNRDGNVYSGAYNYSLMNNGVDQGSVLADGYETAKYNGFVTVQECPWNWIYRNRTKGLDAAAKLNTADAPYPTRTRLGLMTALAMGSIGGVAIEAGPNVERWRSDGISLVDNGGGNHAVVAVDLREVNGVWVFDVYLDWGPQHGHGGFVTLTWDHFEQTAPNHMFWAMPVGQWGG